MSDVHLTDRRVQKLVNELCELVKSRYPDAEFEPYEGEERRAIYVDVYTGQPLDFWELFRELRDLVGRRETEICEQYEMTIMMLPGDKHFRRP